MIIDPEYHYEMRNVEVQHANPHSLLWWTRRILDVRKQYAAFGRGTFESLPSSNSKVFTFLRETEDETILVVANLARVSQHVEIDLSRFSGRTPIELFGHTKFPTIGEAAVRAFARPARFFLVLHRLRRTRIDRRYQGRASALSRTTQVGRSFSPAAGKKMLCDAIESYLRRQRWFAAKARSLQRVDLIDTFELDASSDEPPLRLIFVRTVLLRG